MRYTGAKKVIPSKVTGQYEMDSQGAIVNDMRYATFSPRRSCHFVDDPQAYADGNGNCANGERRVRRGVADCAHRRRASRRRPAHRQSRPPIRPR
ncbi:hypothetical protein [Burkholderia plantarii]|uniref:hypothetical protein n=1 Tax=Burkholderia plantarii TaxID=41899 RepID=UPI0018DEC6F2|nr:hypothetical protein [Burkholderia plantarii]MBI0331607.1 hypothetical protein [Burkholderia plantarii]